MNSLFQDPQLLNKFLEITKTAQTAPAADVQSVARKLVNNLSRTLEGGLSEITSETGNAPTTIAHLGSLNALLKHLADSKIAVDGKRVVYTVEEYASLPDEAKRDLGTITGETLQAVDNRSVGVDYWVNVPILVDYLQHLQVRGGKDEEAGNVQRGKLLQIMSSNLLKKVQHPDIGADVSVKPKTVPEAASLSDETPVDAFGSKTFDEQNPLEDVGVAPGKSAITLTLGDLKSRAALDNWLKQGTSYVVIYGAQGKHAIEYGTEGADSCPIMRVLFLRARDKQNQAANDPVKKRIANAYLQAVQNVGALFTGLDGKPCHISLPETVKTEVAPSDTKEVNPERVTPEMTQAVSQAIALLPFEAGRVSFGRIKQFFNVINTLPQLSEAHANMQQALEAMNTAISLTTTGETTFNLDEPVEQYKYILKDPRTGQITKSWGIPLALLMDALMKVIFHTRQAIVYFWQHYQTPIGAANEKRVLAQIGKTPTDNSLYQQNYTALHRQMPTAS
jgi:hypothetical protein